jgi:predicted ATPase
MRLYSIEYSEFKEESFKWSISDLTFININLLVGKNATGKSRVLRLINALSKLITGNLLPPNVLTGHFKIVLQDDSINPTKPNLTYEVEIYQSKVVKELLEIGDVVKLNRAADERGELWFDELNRPVNIQVPGNSLAVAARRDPKQHKFFEDLHDWANSVNFMEFSNKDQSNATILDKNIKLSSLSKQLMQEHIPLIVKFGKENYGRDLVSPVVSDMRKIGYEITDFGLMPAQGVVSSFVNNMNTAQLIYVQEKGIDKKLGQNEMSAGMYRALVTLIQLHVIQLQKKPSCVLIDDIGEGLDFDRANKLISVIIEQFENGHSQIIMTTNDRFIMNKVPLEYWCILERQTGKVNVFNIRNSFETFNDFEEYGFSNFEFFSKNTFSASN